ncbi:hypothetical protein GJAV_G00001860 [Gymnothorax javanicus]|nr:hypothetical protein GJAV_G00001860 [Gymnothorax javanicus]
MMGSITRVVRRQQSSPENFNLAVHGRRRRGRSFLIRDESAAELQGQEAITNQHKETITLVRTWVFWVLHWELRQPELASLPFPWSLEQWDSRLLALQLDPMLPP